MMPKTKQAGKSKPTRRKAAAATLEEVKLERQRVALECEKARLAIQERKLRKLEEEDRAADGEDADRFRRPYEPNTQGLGERFGIGEHAITALLGDPNAPPKQEKGYNVKEWGQYLLKRRRESAETVALQKAKVAYQMQVLRSKTLENDTREGKLMPVEAHLNTMRQLVTITRDAIQDVRSRVALQGGNALLLKAAEETSKEIVMEIQRRLDEFPEQGEKGGGAVPGTDATRQGGEGGENRPEGEGNGGTGAEDV